MFEDWDWCDTWAAAGLIAAVVFAVILAVYALSTKTVDYYYIGDSQPHAAACVYAHWKWNPDQIAFCTDDGQKAIDFAARANATMHR